MRLHRNQGAGSTLGGCHGIWAALVAFLSLRYRIGRYASWREMRQELRAIERQRAFGTGTTSQSRMIFMTIRSAADTNFAGERDGAGQRRMSSAAR